jgi:hypothetical protein
MNLADLREYALCAAHNSLEVCSMSKDSQQSNFRRKDAPS